MSLDAASREQVDEATLYAHLLRQMVMIRRFEETVNSLFLRGEVYGSTHLCNGQEAVSVGVASLLGPATGSPPPTAATATSSPPASSPQRFLEELLGRAHRHRAAAAPGR